MLIPNVEEERSEGLRHRNEKMFRLRERTLVGAPMHSECSPEDEVISDGSIRGLMIATKSSRKRGTFCGESARRSRQIVETCTVNAQHLQCLFGGRILEE